MICTHNNKNVTCTLGQVQATILSPNPTRMDNLFPMDKVNKIITNSEKRQYMHNKTHKLDV